MASITWFYKRTGKGQVGEIVSYSVPVQGALSSAANGIAGRASAALESKPKVRTGDSQIDVMQADLDYYVLLKDPSVGKRHGGAAGIEKALGILGGSV